MKKWFWIIGVLLLAGCTSTATVTHTPTPSHSSTKASPTPHKTTLAPKPVNALDWPLPNKKLTPGAWVTCTIPRPTSERVVPDSEKNAIAKAYHYTGPRGLQYLEFDHLVPFSLCGDNGPKNLWPELYDGVKTSTYVHNYKDELESKIASMVHHKDLTLQQGQALFLGDWRLAWCKYVHTPGVTCPAKINLTVPTIAPTHTVEQPTHSRQVNPPPTSAPVPTPTHQAAPAPTHAQSDSGCAAAQAWWDANGNHKFSFSCSGCTSCRPQAYTCPTQCTDAPSWTVLINDPCPTAYKNEASNSWTWYSYNGGVGWYQYEVQTGREQPWSVLHAHGLDPYGYSC